MTKTATKTLLCLIALFMAVYCGIALLGLNQDVAKAESTYDISILGTSLSDSNLTFDSSDNASVSGSITYSPDENKLTLNNFKFSGPRSAHAIHVQKSTSTALTVELIGDSEITITENTASTSTAISAFYASERGQIYFVGGGSFTVDNSAFDSSTAALQGPSKDIFVYNSQLIGKGYETAIYYDYRIVAYGENASILATATNPDAINVQGNLWIYPALARSGGYMYSNVNGQKVEVSFNIDGSNPSSTVSNDRGTYASYKYFHIAPVALTVSAYKPNEIGVYYNFTPSTLWFGEKITVTPEPGYVLTNILYTTYTLQPKATLQPDGSYVLDTANADYDQYNTIKFWATYAEAKIINKTPSVGGDYVVPSAGAYNKVVTIIPTPNAGYYTDKVTVTSASGNPITVTGPNADGGYTFVMPKEEVSVSVEFEQLITYDVWVAGIQFDSRNLTIDREDNNAITGSATYDAENNILTLKNFSYAGAGYIFDDGFNNSAIIFAKNELTVKLVGTNVITTTEDRCFDIVSYDLLTITSDTEDKTDGVLTTTCEFCAIDVGSLSISNVTINATGLGAICVNDGDTTINNAIINAIATSEQALLVNDILYVKNSSLTLESQVGTALDSYKWADAFFTIKNSTLTISSQSKGINCSFIDVSNSTIEISAVNEAIYDPIWGEGCVPSFFDSHAVYAGDDSASATLIAEPDYTTYENKYVKIIPAYDVWVAGVQFNASNLTIDNNDNNAITGSATYDAENNILTLDNFSYTGAGYTYIGNANALIYSTGIDLKIVLKGTNKLVGSVDVYEGITIEDGSLTIAGSDEYSDTASLELTVEDMCIYAYGSLSIEKVKLTTTTTALPTSSTTVAICTDGDISIKSSEVTVIAGDSDGDGIIEYGSTIGIMSYGKVEITDSSVNVAANDGGIDADSHMTIDNSTVIIDGGIYGTNVADTSIKNSTVTISGESAIWTNTMYGGDLIISNSNVEMSAQEYAIYDWYYYEPLAYYELNDLTGHVIYGGEDKESATMFTEQDDIFGNKYLRFAPASSVTVNYGIDGVDNEVFKIEKGTTISLETPEINGYALIGWYSESTFENTFDFSAPITEETTIYAKWVVAYDIWVAGIRLNAENLIIDSNDNSTIRGSATYDPTSNTLTLDNFIYESIGDYRGNNDYEPIRVKDGTTINVVGSIDIACNALSDDNYYAIYGLGSLTIIGNGDTDVLYTHGYEGGGIYSSGTLTIQNLKLAVHANQSAIHSEKEITLDKVCGEIYSWLEDGIYVSDFFNSVNILNCNLKIEGYGKGITVHYSVVCFENSFVEIVSDDCYALWDNDRSAVAYVDYSDKHFVYAGWYEDEAEEVNPYDANSFKNNYVKIVPTRKITLNFSSVGLPSEEVFVIVNATAIIETPVIDGYVFIGWYNEDTFETAFDFSTPITENITIYAKFANYTQDIANINSQISSVQSSINALEINLANKADTATLTSNVSDLQSKIDDLTANYQSADATQQAEINALKQQVSTLINDTIVLLNSRVTDIESKIANINNAISTNAGNITANAGKITTLTNELTALQGLVDSLGDTYIDNTELASLKAELVDADNQIKGLIETLTTKVTDIESKIANINNAISTNAGDITVNADKITSLTNELTTLQGLVDSLGDTYIDNTELATAINNLKTELAGVDSEIKGLIETLTTKVTDIESKIANINNAISTNAGNITVNADKITSLTTQLTTLQGVVDSLDNTYIDNTEFASLKDALELADEGLNDLITALTTRVDKTESDIATLVSSKADVTFVNEKISELKGLINALDAVKNNYKTADTELKQDLESQIADAKTYALNTATTLVNNAKAELNQAIALKADTTTVNAKVEELNSAIATAESVAKAYTDGKVTELNSAIATAKQQAIDSATKLVNSAKAELNAAIALKADAATVTAKFAEVDSAIAILQGLSDDYLSADTELKEELTTLIANTKAEIIELIIAGDKANADALEEEIAKLRAEIEALKNATKEDIKEAESNAQVLPTVIASVVGLGDIALLVWLIIKRKIVK